MNKALLAIICFLLYSTSLDVQAGSVSIELHGPEKPPPDDGYTFTGAKGGNGLGKIGLASMGVGVVTSLLFITAEEDSDRKQKLGMSSVSLIGGGFVLLLVERAT